VSVESYIGSIFEVLPPEGKIELTREVWAKLLEQHGTGPATRARPAMQPAPAALAARRSIYKVDDLAGELSRGSSTIRGLLSAGMCGNPEMLKPNDKAFEVPRRIVDALLSQLAEGHALGTFCLYQPEPSWKTTPSVQRTSSDVEAVPAACAAASNPTPPVVAAASSGQRSQQRSAPASTKTSATSGLGQGTRLPATPKTKPPAKQVKRAGTKDDGLWDGRTRVTDLGGWRTHLPSGGSA
jgi:hypothetical protein